MTDHADQLREAFETHEDQTPDPSAVYARVQELSQKYQRRRRGMQIAGGSVLGAGLIAGALNLAPILPGNQTQQPAGVQLQVGAPVTSVTPLSLPPQSSKEQDADWAAYFGAGYGYDDAVALAKLWNTKAPIGAVKAEAGRRLRAGESLPFKPLPTQSTPPPSVDPNYEKDTDAFFNAGYQWSDAVKLAKIWHLADPSDAKVKGGKELLEGKKLPVQPSPANVAAAKDAAAANAFWNAGYDYDDAVKLAKLWHVSDPSKVKVLAGKKLLAGETLPFKP